MEMKKWWLKLALSGGTLVALGALLAAPGKWA